MEEKENAIKWHRCYTELQHDHSKTLRESGENLERANNAEAQVESMAQALTEAAKKAQKDAQEIKDLQETNKLLLERYQQNESLLQRFLSRATPPAPPQYSQALKKLHYNLKSADFKMSCGKSSSPSNRSKKQRTKHWTRRKNKLPN